jgi:hypothetical protein
VNTQLLCGELVEKKLPLVTPLVYGAHCESRGSGSIPERGTHGLYLRESLIMTLIPFGTGAKLAL